MVGLVIVSHSSKLAEGVKELSSQMAPGVLIEAAGGTEDGRLGTDVSKITNAIEKVYSEDGVIVLFDLGSAYMNTEIAIECLDEDKLDKVKIVDCALVEGAVEIAVKIKINNSLEEIINSIEALKLNKMP